MDFSDKSSGFADLKNIADQLKVLARFLDSVSLEVRIADRIINFRSVLVVVRGAVASWLVRSAPDRAVRVRDLAGDIALCS